jgi:hypothetical protein
MSTTDKAAWLEKLRVIDADPEMFDEGEPCIPWRANLDKDGYPMGRWRGKKVRMLRVIYCLTRRVPISALDGLVIRHGRCSGPTCHNFKHLRAGTVQENVADMMALGRHAPRSVTGLTLLTDEQVIEARRAFIPRHREYSASALARRIGVDASTMYNAIMGRTFADLPGACTPG